MSKEKETKKKCDCDENCTCGCQDGKECSCHGDKCDCGCQDKHIKNCGCKDGEECTCGDDCNCGEECDCKHNEGHCDCNDECDCGCNHEHLDKDEIIKKYEIAFGQFEEALIKVDKELAETKKKAEENERLAITYRKDLERFKERTKEQEENMKISAVSNVADKLIPILDNFEQALKVTGDPNVLKGFEMVEGMLKNAVKSLGIEEIETENCEFDPNLHNAVSKKKTKDSDKNNKIASVYQKGYKMAGEGGKIIRHSMVEIYLQD